MKIEVIEISKVKNNPNNPRIIKDDKFKKLVQSIKDFPEMLNIRPVVCNADMIVLGGNMRLKACKEAGLKEVPVIMADNLTEEQQREFIIKDNVSGGEWDWEQLANEWDSELISDWGLDVPDEKEEKKDGDIVFSTELDQESNYIVLKFSKDIDWLQLLSHYKIKTTYAKRANGKPWSKGQGRVVDGVDFIQVVKSC